MGGPFNFAATEDPVRVTVDHQRQHHRGWELLAATAPLIDLSPSQIKRLHRIYNEVHHVIPRHPITHIWRQQHSSSSIDVYKTCGHSLTISNRNPFDKENRSAILG